MSLTDTIKKLVGDFIRDTMIITLERINSNGREPITFRHMSGAVIELRDDGEVYINGIKVELGGSGLDHALLDNLTWSTSGHTINTNVDMNLHDIDDVGGIFFDSSATSGTAYINLSYSGELGEMLTYRAYSVHLFNVATQDIMAMTTSGMIMYKNLNMGSLGITNIASLYMVNTVDEFSIDGTLSGNSDTAVPTEKAIKTYITTVMSALSNNHDDLDNLAWSVAGHTMDASLNMVDNDIVNCGDIESSAGKRVYIDKQTTDAASTYLKVDGTSGNLQFHVPTGKAIEYHVGDGI